MGMFSRDDTADPKSSEITVISEGMSIFGEIAAKDNVYINGSFTGKIVAKGEIAVGPQGKIEGHLTAATLRVAGLVDGNVECKTLCVLPSGKVYGNLCSAKLEIHPGGFIDADHRSRPTEPQAAAEATTGTTAPVESEAAVVTPLHARKDSPWALKKPSFPSYRHERDPEAAAAKPSPANAPATPAPPAAATPEPNRWHGSRNRREAS